MTPRAEDDWMDGKPPVPGTATLTDEEHGPHAYLYVPDLSAQTRWTAHRVPERVSERTERRPLGFHRHR